MKRVAPGETPWPRADVPSPDRWLLRRWALAQWLPSLGLILAALAVWEGAVRAADVPRWLLPPPSAIAMEMWRSRALLLSHAGVTLEEVAVGFLLALASGVALAVGIASSRVLERAIYPFVIASQTVPIIAIAPLLLIWAGYGIASKVIVVALISFFPIVVNMVDGLRSVDPDMVNMMRTLGASRRQVFTKVQVPTSLPYLFSGVRVAVAVSVIGAVIGEWVGSSAGLGYLMVHSAPQFLTARVFGAIVVLSLVGIGLFALVGVAERYFLPWYRSAQREKALRP